MTDADYWAELPDDTRVVLSEIAWRYLRLETVPDYETAVHLLALQRLDTEVMEAHNRWLERAKAKVERSGREWNRENFLRYVRLREHE